MAEDAVMYKLVGPVLVKQTKAEVASTVEERLKFVNGEMYVIGNKQIYDQNGLYKTVVAKLISTGVLIH